MQSKDAIDDSILGNLDPEPEHALWLDVIAWSIRTLRNPLYCSMFFGRKGRGGEKRKEAAIEMALEYERNFWKVPEGARLVCETIGLDYEYLREKLTAEGLL